MKSNSLLVACGVLAIALTSALLHPAANAQNGTGVQRSLDGVWLVTTTPRNCETGIAGPVFEGLFTFHADGTLSAWMQTAFITTERSPSHGLWRRERGWSHYSFRFVLLRYDASSYSGRQESGGSLVLDASGNMFTTDSSTQFFDATGNFLGQGCGSAVGIRFQ